MPRAFRWLVAAGAFLLVFLCLAAAGVLAWHAAGGNLPGLAQPEAVPDKILFEDDFADTGSGWDVYRLNGTEAGYVDQEYRLAVFRSNFTTWANPPVGNEFADFVVEVEARLVEGSLDNNYGVLFRYQRDNQNFYWFQISSDGYYSVDLLRANQWITLVRWERSEAISQGHGVVNHLKVVCNGNHFRFYVNGVYLTELVDNAFSSGNVGLGAGVFDRPGVVIHFDNLKVYRLAE